MSKSMPVFSVRGLEVAFKQSDSTISVVSGLSIDIAPGEVTGIVGESGSGKSTAMLSAIGYTLAGMVRVRGEAMLGGVDLLQLERSRLRAHWGRQIGYVPQDAGRSLDPTRRIGSQISEVLRVNMGLGRPAARARAIQLLEELLVPNATEAEQRYAYQFSGGQLQRIAMAMALACEPRLLILDEPTTGLDVTTQDAILSLIRATVEKRNMAVILISHDLALVGTIADRIVIFYAGEVVESGTTSEVLGGPRHPYTRALLDAVPSVSLASRPTGLPGLPPTQVVRASCSFAPRCRFRVEDCSEAHPELQNVDSSSRRVRCIRTKELGLLVEQQQPIARRSARRRGKRAPLLTVRGLICEYRGKGRDVIAVDGVDLDLFPGEVVGLVGESGSGKSTIARCIAGAVPYRSGSIELEGHPLPTLEHRSTDQCRQIQLIFQDPDSSLNPRQSVSQLIGRAAELIRSSTTASERKATVMRAIIDVQLDPSMGARYPHQLSGGQKQRVAIARAFAPSPLVVLADEILTGQDVSVQATLLELMQTMQRKHGTTLLFISHDLAVVRSIAQYTYVMKDGRIIEEGVTDQLFNQPQEEYTRELLAAVPDMDSRLGRLPKSPSRGKGSRTASRQKYG